VADLCAAPGGKTAQLAAAGAIVTAVDRSATRVARLRQNLSRLQVEAAIVVADAGEWQGGPFDAVLLDAPCSALGVVRRHPDAKWLRRSTDVAAFARTQRAILDALWPLVARDGVLLYVTCSVFREENEARIVEFTARHADALREPITFPAGVRHSGGQLLPSAETTGHNQDGFFYARLRKA